MALRSTTYGYDHAYGHASQLHELVDDQGRPISLRARHAEGAGVLYYGVPGTGKRSLLDDARVASEQAGHLVVSIDFTRSEAAGGRIGRALMDDFDQLRDRYAGREPRELFAQRLDRLFTVTRRLMGDDAKEYNEWRTPGQVGAFGFNLGLPQKVRRTEDPGQGKIDASLNELVEALGELAATEGRRAVMLIDGIDAGSEADLASALDMVRHIRHSNIPANVVATGGRDAVDKIIGFGGDQIRMWDTRLCQPFQPEELRESLRQRLASAGVRADPAAMSRLVGSVNGMLPRLQDIGKTAVAMAMQQPYRYVDVRLAEQVIASVSASNQRDYQGHWNNALKQPGAQGLIRDLAEHGPGLDLVDLKQSIGTEDGRERLEGARVWLENAGVIRVENGMARFADEGMGAWVRDRERLPEPAQAGQQLLTAQGTAAVQPGQQPGYPPPGYQQGYPQGYPPPGYQQGAPQEGQRFVGPPPGSGYAPRPGSHGEAPRTGGVVPVPGSAQRRPGTERHQ